MSLLDLKTFNENTKVNMVNKLIWGDKPKTARIYKHDLEETLLKKAGVLISKEVLDKVYAQANADKNGLFSLEDIAKYNNNIQVRTWNGKVKAVTKQTLFC